MVTTGPIRQLPNRAKSPAEVASRRASWPSDPVGKNYVFFERHDLFSQQTAHSYVERFWSRGMGARLLNKDDVFNAAAEIVDIASEPPIITRPAVMSSSRPRSKSVWTTKGPPCIRL